MVRFTRVLPVPTTPLNTTVEIDMTNVANTMTRILGMAKEISERSLE